MTCTLHLGDCLSVLATLADASVDAIVVDPPYGLVSAPPEKVAACLAAWLAGKVYSPSGGGFMNQDWDAWVPGPEVWRECLRVLRPGGHLVAFAGTRMHDLMSIAIRLGGFEIRDEIALQWSYGQGFPKSVNAGRAIDMELCVLPGRHFDKRLPRPDKRIDSDHLCPTHELGDPWRHAGTALKPSYEPIVLARRPLDGLVGHNVLTHGTALDIEGCRVDPNSSNTGRWPPNMLLVHHPECQQVGTRRVKTGTAVRKNGKGGQFFGQPTPKLAGPSADVSFGKDGYEEIPEWRCHPQCPVRAIDDQSGTLKSGDSPGFVGDVAHSQSMGSKVAMIRPESTYGDMGGASRFFPTFHYAAKASKTERNAGCDDLPERDDRGTRNHHPTLKPLAVMRWLVRLVTPMPDPVVLDCFMGSGTCGLACAYEGASYIGIEKDPDYYAIARARIEWSWGRIHEATPSTPDRPEPAANQQDLFR